MFCLLTGKLVHDGHTANEILLSAMTTPAPPVATVAPMVTPAVARLVDKALAFDREKRWLDAGRMQEALRHAYIDRYGAQITTAPKLTVPETVPNRTLAGADSATLQRLPTTAQPVASSQADAGVAPRSRLPRWLLNLVAVAAGAAVVVTGVGWAVSAARHEPAVASSSSTAHTPVPGPAPPARTSVDNALPPAVAATDLPTVLEATPQPSAAPPAAVPLRAPMHQQAAVAPKVTVDPAARASAEAATASPAAKPNCNPPYTIDPATGKKHFKVECI